MPAGRCWMFWVGMPAGGWRGTKKTLHDLNLYRKGYGDNGDGDDDDGNGGDDGDDDDGNGNGSGDGDGDGHGD